MVMVIGHPHILFSAFHLTAGSDYIPGPYTVSFSAGQASAILMVSTIDDDVVELSESFMVTITSVVSMDNVEIGSPSTSFVRIVSSRQLLLYSYPGTLTLFCENSLLYSFCMYRQMLPNKLRLLLTSL